MNELLCKKCGKNNVVLIEYNPSGPHAYDGASEIQCDDCGARFGRWSGKELAKGEIEKPYGRP